MRLAEIATYVNEKISSSNITLDQYVTTDSLLQDKRGREYAQNLPPVTTNLIHYQPGDILVANIRPYLKKVWFADCEGGASSDVLVIRAKTPNDTTFVYALLMQDSFYDYAMKGAKGSKMPRGDKDQIMRYEFPIFSPEQRLNIGKFITDIESKIAVNRQINDNLEAMAKQLYDYWFVQFDFPNEVGKPYKSSGGKMVWNDKLKREIPEGWDVKSINDLSTICRGVSYKPSDLQDNGVLILRGNNIENNRIIYDNNTAFLSPNLISAEQKIKRHDIIITMSSGSKEHIGKCAMFQLDSEHSFGAFLSKIAPNKDCPHFIFLFLSSTYFKQKIKSVCNGTGINNLTNQTFDEVKFAYPTPNTLKLFERRIQSIFDTIGNNDAENEALTKQRDELLPLLMNGQVSVNYHLSHD
jgi:type I restriction enzyme S subunit